MKRIDSNMRWMGAALGLAGALGALGVLAACATGVDPVRPGGSGGGTGAGGDIAGPSSSSGTFTTTGGGGDPSTTSTSATTGVGGGTSTSATTSTGPSSSSAASSSAASSSASSTSGAGGGPVAGLSLQYLNADVNVNDNQMKPHFNVVNNSGAAVPLSTLTLRYYFTAEGNPPLFFDCDYAMVGCANITGSFAATSGTNADHYLELAFSGGAGSVSDGGQSGEIQARPHNQDYSPLNQGNDYSFDASKTAFTPWDHVTLYHNGALVWGVEP